MIFIVYSETNAASVQTNLGVSEYSYYFVLKTFRPLLERLGTVVEVLDPRNEVDTIYLNARARGEDCIFLSFSPPHRTALELACPTVPVFAWEFDTIPSETWYNEPEQDWRFVFNKIGRAITHSSFSVSAAKAAMGDGFPIVCIPAPIWDLVPEPSRRISIGPDFGPHSLDLKSTFIDSRTFDWSRYTPFADVDAPPSELSGSVGRLTLDGVVYTSIFNPYDRRKNQTDMLAAFCAAFRKIEDATLVLKLTHRDSSLAIDELMTAIYALSPMQCRIVLIDGYMDDLVYWDLMRATTFAVNASRGEGQCLPLMEYMAGGKPAVSPRHTAMLDYLTPDNAFLVDSSLEPGTWPHDPRAAYRTLRGRIDCESLVRAYRESHRVAKHDGALYGRMSSAARQAQRLHCSVAVASERMSAFLATLPRPRHTDSAYGCIVPRDIALAPSELVDFATDFDSRRYLLSGWSMTEFGFGVWSDGSVAEVAFCLPELQSGQKLLRVNITAFLGGRHIENSVAVCVNGKQVDRWNFTLEDPHSIGPLWHDVAVPSGEVRIKFSIERPVSPLELGLSQDSRHLGIAMHQLAVIT